MGPRKGAELRIVPSSIQRVRCFLNTRGRMKVKPWASAQEVLDALRSTLLARREDEAFWKDIEDLLAALCRDAASRAACSVPNEVLDPARLGALVAEIRNARPAGPGFRSLCRALSAPAATLLIIMAGALVVGCEQGAILRGVPDASADVASEETADATPDGWCPHEDIPIEEIVRECVASEEERVAMLACLEALDASWHTGLKEYLECMQCYEVSDKLYHCFLEGCPRSGEPWCNDPAATGEFDLEAFLDSCCYPLYIGVRFD